MVRELEFWIVCFSCVTRPISFNQPPTTFFQLQTTADAIAGGSGVDAVGDVALTPATPPRALPWHPRHAVSICNLQTQSPRGAPAGPPTDLCPRSALAAAVKLADAEYGLTFRFGWEHEFLLKRKDGGTPSLPPPTNYAHTLTLDAAAALLDAIVDAATGLGVTVEQWHGEASAAGFEVVAAHAPPLDSADGVLLTRESITQVTARAGHDAVLLPKPDPAGVGQGAHVHFSVWKGGENVTAGLADPTTRNATGAAFVAGVLHHLPALVAITAGGPTSALRRAPGFWAGAFVCWGAENKEAPVRVLADNVELKAVDATAPPHLALAAIIAAGLAGVKEGLQLPPPADGPTAATGAAPAGAAAPVPLPPTTADAVAALLSERHRSAFESVLGAPVVAAVAALREADGRALATWPVERVVRELALTY